MWLWSRLIGRIPRAREMKIDPASRWLVLAPHPDDETLGAGGLMARAVRLGAQVSVLVLTDGARLPRLPGQEAVTKAEFIAGRRAQCRAALAVLGVARVTFLDAADRQLARHSGAIREAVTAALRETAPTHVLIPHPADRHRDHRACWPLLSRALARARAAPVVLGYEIWLPCRATDCLDISDAIAAKRAAIECYRGSFRDVDLGEMAAGLNRYRAATELFRDGWCEAFQRLR